jgi:hypothetical protein
MKGERLNGDTAQPNKQNLKERLILGFILKITKIGLFYLETRFSREAPDFVRVLFGSPDVRGFTPASIRCWHRAHRRQTRSHAVLFQSCQVNSDNSVFWVALASFEAYYSEINNKDKVSWVECRAHHECERI